MVMELTHSNKSNKIVIKKWGNQETIYSQNKKKHD